MKKNARQEYRKYTSDLKKKQKEYLRKSKKLEKLVSEINKVVPGCFDHNYSLTHKLETTLRKIPTFQVWLALKVSKEKGVGRYSRDQKEALATVGPRPSTENDNYELDLLNWSRALTREIIAIKDKSK